MLEEVEVCTCNVAVVQHLHSITEHVLHLLLAYAEWQYHGIPSAAAECAVFESYVILIANCQTFYRCCIVFISVESHLLQIFSFVIRIFIEAETREGELRP